MTQEKVYCECGHPILLGNNLRWEHEIEGRSLDGPACASCGCRKPTPAWCPLCDMKIHETKRAGLAVQLSNGRWVCFECRQALGDFDKDR